MMRNMDLLDAADLAKNSYKGPSRLPPVLQIIDDGHVQAFLLKDMTLVIPGSNQLIDYTDANLVTGNVKISWNKMGKAAGNAIWHKGFANYASVITRKLGSRKPTFIIGHSLGAAAAQILGCVYGVPAIAFASPKPRRGPTRLLHEHKVLNIVRNDDFVCRMPPKKFGFRWVGNTEVMHPPRNNPGEDHSMPHYIKLMKIERAQGKIVKSWPA